MALDLMATMPTDLDKLDVLSRDLKGHLNR